ncbi:MAG TPA: S1/P1 nuclease [Allosphingosinicella sp.]|nr:S1/P1 nuclease [Allosphingosinicella sp.]
MNLKRLFVLAAAALACAAAPAIAWGPTGHSEVGAIADELLKDHPRAQAQVRAILGPITLAQAGPWADCLRSVSGPPGFAYAHSDIYGAPCVAFEGPELKAQMEDYVRRNWSNCASRAPGGCHTQYHFLDVALQRQRYEDGLVGTNEYDIVHAINAAIVVLRGGRSPAPFDFTRRDALMMLTHLIGDLHQPLHVGAVFLDEQGRVVDPDSSDAERRRAERATLTNGGNSLIWTEQARQMNLHSAWDGIAPRAYSLDYARSFPATTGPLESWTASWATDTLIQARGALSGLNFGAKSGNRWPLTFDNRTRYDSDRAATQRLQIEKAGARLAQVLVAIWPD